MRHDKRIGPLYRYDEDGCPVEALGDVEWHSVSQRHKGRLAASGYYIELDQIADRKMQAISLVSARQCLRSFIENGDMGNES